MRHDLDFYKDAQTNFTKEMVSDTSRYQKKYGFQIGENNFAVDNEADAFRHTFMQAYLSIFYGGNTIAKLLGDKHEDSGRQANGEYTPSSNMDLWNNEQGREIAEELKKEFGGSLTKIFTDDAIKDIIADRVIKRMKSGQLMTTPDDTRKFEEKKSENITGEAANIEDLERIFTAEEIGDMSNDEYALLEKYLDNQMQTFGIPRKTQADEEVKSGNLIWVNSYTRTDGTKVTGYYRQK